MFKIVQKEVLAPIIKKIVLSAPYIAEKAKPGQFIIIRVHEKGERIPLTISSTNSKEGTITIIFQEAGKTTKLLGTMKEGDYILDVVGPLGKPTEIEKYGTVVCIGGGVGTAVMYPITRALKSAGNKIISIIGAREKNLLILEKEMRMESDTLYITTDDGSYGEKGFVSDVLERLIKDGIQIDLVFAIGPLPMMKVICDLTKNYNIKTMVSLDSIMVDGTGMCGSCRVSVGGETKFTCVDGPDFDGHLVDWDELRARKSLFQEMEAISLKKFEEEKKGR